MDTDIQAEIKSVRTLSKYLRSGCTTLIVGFALIAALILFFWFAGKGTLVMGAFNFPAGQQTLAMQLYAFMLVGCMFAVIFGGLIQLRSLFVNLNAGEIYTIRNVQHLRRLGQLALALAVFQAALPVLDAILVASGVFDKAMLRPNSGSLDLLEGRLNFIGLPKILGPFIMAGLVILASWIMDMGRRTSEDADRMRRDAELVV